jgi:hypothetical protein
VAESKWAREVVFLVLYIVPVYPIAGMLDLVIFNSIEFHGGKNPISGQTRLAMAGAQRVAETPDGTRGVSTLRADGSIDLAVTGADGSEHFVNLTRLDGYTVARDAVGTPLAYVGPDGQVVSGAPVR